MVKSYRLFIYLPAVFICLILIGIPTGLSSADDTQDYTEIPSSFDMRDIGISEVRNQMNLGLCWTFAACESLESYLFASGMEELNTELSEALLAYFTFNISTDPLGGTEGDSVTVYPNVFTRGGDDYFTAFTLAKWSGLTSEETQGMLYSDITQYTTFSSDLTYSDQIAYLKGMEILNITTDTDKIKERLMEGYAATCSFYMDPDLIYEVSGSDDRSYYCGNVNSANHEVTLVGWDDNYSASNFKETPAGDGAWLIKNSWGTGGLIGDGYMWISYYDVNFSNYVTFFQTVSTDTYDRNYQYDGGISINSDITATSGSMMSNVFTAQEFEDLKAIAMPWYMDKSMNYTISIYTDLTDSSDPTSGVLESITKGSVDGYGYYVIDLSQSVYLKDGETFSVVVCLESQDGSDISIGVDTDETGYNNDGTLDYICDTTALEGQSFIYTEENGWVDIGADGSSNVRLKAYTVDTDETTVITAGIIFAIIVSLIIVGAVYTVFNNKLKMN